MGKVTEYDYNREPIPYIPVAVEESNLPGMKAKYGRVLARTVYESEMVKKLHERHRGVSEDMILFIPRLYHAELIDALKHGNAVSLCGMGVLSPQVDGAVTDQQIANGRGLKYTLKFTPSAQAAKATKNFRTEFVSKSTKNPVIARATMDRTGENLSEISDREIVSIMGQNLLFRKDRHFGSEKSGVFFSNISTKETFRIAPKHLISKSDKKLRLYTPDLPDGDYQMFVQKATLHSDGKENLQTSPSVRFSVRGK